MNKKLMVCINGSGGVGKDSFIDFCRNIGYSKNIYVANLSTIDMIRQAGRLLGCVNKTEIDRKFLSDLKILSKEYNNHPRDYIEVQIKNFCKSTGNTIIFVHSREPKEIDEFKLYFIKNKLVDCFTTMLVKNDKVKHINSNHADKNVEKYDYDIDINNNGTLNDLRLDAQVFVKMIANDYFKKEL